MHELFRSFYLSDAYQKKVEKNYKLLIHVKCINGINHKASRISSPSYYNKVLIANYAS